MDSIMGPNGLVGAGADYALESRAPAQPAAPAARLAGSSSIGDDDGRRQEMLSACLAGLDLGIAPAPAPTTAATLGVWGDPWAAKTALTIEGLAPLSLPPPAMPPRSASMPSNEERAGGLDLGMGLDLGDDKGSVHEELARMRAVLALTAERNQLLEGALREQLRQGWEQQEKIKLLTRINKDFRKEIAQLQSQVWSQVSSSLTRTPAPNARGGPRISGPLVPPPTLGHQYAPPSHHRARSGSGSPPGGEGRSNREGREARGVHVV